jgi:hypothetical protein
MIESGYLVDSLVAAIDFVGLGSLHYPHKRGDSALFKYPKNALSYLASFLGYFHHSRGTNCVEVSEALYSLSYSWVS